MIKKRNQHLFQVSKRINQLGFEFDKILQRKDEYDKQVRLFKKNPYKLTSYEIIVINEALCRIIYAQYIAGKIKKEDIPSNIIDNFPFEVGW